MTSSSADGNTAVVNLVACKNRPWANLTSNTCYGQWVNTQVLGPLGLRVGRWAMYGGSGTRIRTRHNHTCTHQDIHLLKFLEFESPLQNRYLCTCYALLVLHWAGLTLTAITHLHPWNEWWRRTVSSHSVLLTPAGCPGSDRGTGCRTSCCPQP